MARFQIPPGSGNWYDAPDYATARQMHALANAPVAVAPAPVAVGPAAVTFTVVITPVDNFAGRSMTRFGVGEELDLSFTTVPPRTAASFGGLRWHIKSGPATLAAPVPADGTARLVMGERAGTVVLELRTVPVGGAAAEVKALKTLWVVEPGSAVIVQEPGTGVYHRQNTASAGFFGLIRWRPTDVSFYRCDFREGSAPIRATGSLSVNIATSAPSSASSGQGQAVRQELTNLAGARHPVMGSWIPMGRGHSVDGSEMQGHDDITSATLNPPFAAGTFDWDIHWLFRVRGSRNEKVFHTATHSEVCTAAGQMTISKAGCSITCAAASVNSDK
jgi:hypothetical protein